MITLLGENTGGSTPSQSDLEDWADTHGLSHPVVADTNFGVAGAFVEGNSIGLPSFSMLGPGAEVIYADSFFGESEVENNLP